MRQLLLLLGGVVGSILPPQWQIVAETCERATSWATPVARCSRSSQSRPTSDRNRLTDRTVLLDAERLAGLYTSIHCVQSATPLRALLPGYVPSTTRHAAVAEKSRDATPRHSKIVLSLFLGRLLTIVCDNDDNSSTLLPFMVYLTTVSPFMVPLCGMICRQQTISLTTLKNRLETFLFDADT